MTQQENKTKKTPHAHTSMSFPNITSFSLVLQPQIFFCNTVDEKDVDSDAASFYPTFYLDCYMKADKGGKRNS